MRGITKREGYVSDIELTEKEFIDKYMVYGIYTEEYLKLRWKWMHLKKGDDRVQITKEMFEAYTQTEAYRINYIGKKGGENANV